MASKKREGVYVRGERLWIRYTIRGHKYREPVETTSRKKAADLRVDRIAEIKRGERTASGDKLTVSDLLDLVVTDYQVNSCRSLEGTRGQLEAVRTALGTRRAPDVTTEAIKRMQARWLEAGASPATVNRRCDKLRRGFRLAQQAGLLHLVPYVPRLKEPKHRGRYIRPEDLASFTTHLPAYVLPLLQFAHLNGTRRGQLARTQRRFVDLHRALIAWPPAEVKADDPHTLPLEGESLAIVRTAMQEARTFCPLPVARATLRRRPSGVEAIRLRRRLEEGVGAGDGAGGTPRGAEGRGLHVSPHPEHGGDRHARGRDVHRRHHGDRRVEDRGDGASVRPARH
jgi:hypothetical protein